MKRQRGLFLFTSAVMILLGILILLLLGILIFAYGYSAGHGAGWPIIIAAVGLVLTASVIILRVFYLPICRIEKRLRKLDIADSQAVLQLQEDAAIYPFVGEIEQLLQRMRSSMEQEYSNRILKKQAELAALQSQINPHFLYNTLDSIRSQVLREGADEAADTLESLSMLFRYSISHRQALTTLEQELENADNYIRIMQYRFGSRFEFVKRINTADSRIMGCRLPPLTLQPIIENAIEHGFERKREKGIITVRTIIFDGLLQMSVSDNGAGIEPAELDRLNDMLHAQNWMERTEGQKRGSGIALLNVNERIKLLFGGEYGLHLCSARGLGTEVQIILPLRYSGPEGEYQ